MAQCGIGHQELKDKDYKKELDILKGPGLGGGSRYFQRTRTKRK